MSKDQTFFANFLQKTNPMVGFRNTRKSTLKLRTIFQIDDIVRFSSSGNEEKKICGEENFLRFLKCVKPKKNELNNF